MSYTKTRGPLLSIDIDEEGLTTVVIQRPGIDMERRAHAVTDQTQEFIGAVIEPGVRPGDEVWVERDGDGPFRVRPAGAP